MVKSAVGFNIFVSVPLLVFAAASCESSEGGDELLQAAPVSQRPPTATTPPSSRAEREIVRKSIGQQGGTIEGEGAVIAIPEGALAQDTLIIIKEVDPMDVQLPFRGALAGKVYAFEPENLTFAKPVTISITTDPARRPPTGAVVLLRSPKALSAWETRGGGAASEPTVSAETDHFSDWVPFAIPEERCLFGTSTCSRATPDAGGTLDCRMPDSKPGVRCAQSPNGKFNCTCTDGAVTIATFAPSSPPADSALSALAAACGASCEQADAGEEGDADLPPTDSGLDPDSTLCTAVATCGLTQSALPDGGMENGWACATTESSTTNALTCRHVDDEPTATCTCAEGNGGDAAADASSTSFTIVTTNNAPPTEAMVVQFWRDRCGGVCQSPIGDAGAGDASTD